MKKILLLITLAFVLPALAEATAIDETGDSRAVPVSTYGTDSTGAIVPLLCNALGELVVEGGSSGTVEGESDSGTFTDGNLDANHDITISLSLSSSSPLLVSLLNGSDEDASNEPTSITYTTNGDGKYDGFVLDFSSAITGTYKWTAVGNVSNSGGGDDITVGDVTVNGDLNTTGDAIIGGTLTASSMTVVGVGNTNIDDGTLFVNATTNRVGVGTITPNDKVTILPSSGDGLTIRESDNGNDALVISAFNSTCALTLLNSGASTNGISFSSGGVSYINSGNLGIGDATPDAKLDVEGDAIISNGLTINDNVLRVADGVGSPGGFYIESDGVDAFLRTTNDHIKLKTVRTNDDIIFVTNSIESARFDADTSGLKVFKDLTASANVFFINLPSGSTQPAGVIAGQLWLDTDDQTVKVGT